MNILRLREHNNNLQLLSSRLEKIQSAIYGPEPEESDKRCSPPENILALANESDRLLMEIFGQLSRIEEAIVPDVGASAISTGAS